MVMRIINRIKKVIFNNYTKRNSDKKIPFFTKDFFHNPNYTIGDYSYGKPSVLDWNEGANLRIGKFCSIAENVTIFLGGNHRSDWISTYPFSVLYLDFPNAKGIKGHPSTNGDVVIGNDVWIGRGATIMSGVHIGDGAIIGANTVVSKDVEPYSIVVGNPCKEVRKRFDSESIDKLLSIKWWDWPVSEINEKIHVILSNRLENLK